MKVLKTDASVFHLPFLFFFKENWCTVTSSVEDFFAAVLTLHRNFIGYLMCRSFICCCFLKLKLFNHLSFCRKNADLACLKGFAVIFYFSLCLSYYFYCSRSLSWKIQFWMVSHCQRFSKKVYFWNLKKISRYIGKKIIALRFSG